MIPAALGNRLAALASRRQQLADQRARLEEDTAAAILEARDAGGSLAEVAAAVGMSRAGVSKAEDRARAGR